MIREFFFEALISEFNLTLIEDLVDIHGWMHFHTKNCKMKHTGLIRAILESTHYYGAYYLCTSLHLAVDESLHVTNKCKSASCFRGWRGHASNNWHFLTINLWVMMQRTIKLKETQVCHCGNILELYLALHVDVFAKFSCLSSKSRWYTNSLLSAWSESKYC